MNDVGGWGQDINTLNGVGSTVPEEVSPPSPLFPVLGNILLSSCPGKKVRLSGPVKGRGAICRDLGHDLRRIRSLGVGCIICCLDDEELELLGVSWSQYSEIAHAIGLDVLRIPIPEGLTPISPAFIDYHLTNIIHQYTLQGVPVLVHCRGGVGRAGLVACCWILKLGLCGWLNHQQPHQQQQQPGVGSQYDPQYQPDNSPPHGMKIRGDTISLVERVISVMRRRRSVKAIETYEQVRFLVEFVEWMRRVEEGA
ncbi:hypothetical protein M422DRAFT_179064 [Sphaerobolus stellatus SS14]|uniref:Tyrosine specific protein phosphatases domain-containing protein n=1 Tax=Sphaerobolus stellatus (strain SS14) TaxID=990650 RepID=A0A0C9VHC0_SPHS4|nr:hypothetical protein M422DRAFT_179064 [Sphaerobolus stellatus SS14]